MKGKSPVSRQPSVKGAASVMQNAQPGLFTLISSLILKSIQKLQLWGGTMSGKSTFEPMILGFLCNWCAYGAADLAGVSRFQYPSNLKAIRVPCSGRVDPVFFLDAFLHGYDGVWVGG